MSKKKSKHQKNKNNKSYKKIAFVVAFILIIFIGIKNANKESKNEETQIILNNENITGQLQNDVIIEDDKIYMDFEDVQKLLDSTLYKEDETGLIITTSSKKIATFKEGEDVVNINGSEQKEKDIVIEKEGKEYIAISELENVYDYEFQYIKSNNIVTIDSLNKKSIKAYASKNIKIKESNSKFANTIEKVEKGNWVIYISEENGTAKVRTQDGKIGYIKSKYLVNFVTEREDWNENNTKNDIQSEKTQEYDLSKKDITTYEKRKNIINLILQEAIKNDNMYVKIIYNGTEEQGYNRFKIEIIPILSECGIKVEF